jgi:hypothetical protein
MYIWNTTKYHNHLIIRNKEELFLEAFIVIYTNHLKTERDIYFNEVFWHSILTVYKRDYLLETYPQINEELSIFNNIVLEKFDWENYVYKCILGDQYIIDNVEEMEKRERYYKLIIDNLEVYYYIIKYRISEMRYFLTY